MKSNLRASSQGFVPLLRSESFSQQIQLTGAGMLKTIRQISSFFIISYVVTLVANINYWSFPMLLQLVKSH